MTLNAGLFTSLTPHWATPQGLYKQLDAEFHFDFDPCPLHTAFDGLAIEWGMCNYVNPPYGRMLGLWLKKAVEESRKGKTIVMLLPSRTDTKWFHDYVLPCAKEIRFIRGRIKFENAERERESHYSQGAPFPSCIVIFKGDFSRRRSGV